MAQYVFSSGNVGRPNFKLALEASYHIEDNSDDLSRMGSYSLTEQERLGMVATYGKLRDTLSLHAGVRWRAVEKEAGISQFGAIALDAFRFEVESDAFSGIYNKNVSIYLPAALSDASGGLSMTSDDAIDNIFTSDRLGASQKVNEYSLFYNADSGTLSAGNITYDTGYNTSENLAEAEAVTADTDPATGAVVSNWLLGAITATTKKGFRLVSGTYIEAASGGSVGADLGWDASGFDDTTPSSTIIGRTVRAGSAANFLSGKTHQVSFGASAFTKF